MYIRISADPACSKGKRVREDTTSSQGQASRSKMRNEKATPENCSLELVCYWKLQFAWSLLLAVPIQKATL